MSNPFSPYVPHDYPRICDLCGNLKRISQLHKQESWWICDDHPGWRTREELARGNAKAKPFPILPVDYPKPQDREGPNVYEAEEGQLFNFLCSQQIDGEDGTRRAGVPPYELLDISGLGYGAPIARADDAPFRLHQSIANTIGLWQFQNSLKDLSGNGLDLAMSAGDEAYTALDGCLYGFDFNGSRLLIGPDSPLPRLTDEYTIEFLLLPKSSTALQTYVQCDTTTALATNMYANFYNTASVGMSYNDMNTGVAEQIGSPSPILQGTFGRANHIVFRRSDVAGLLTIECFLNGVLQSGSAPSTTPITAGSQRLKVGGWALGPNLIAAMASLRIVNYARTAAQIKADYNYTLGRVYGII